MRKKKTIAELVQAVEQEYRNYNNSLRQRYDFPFQGVGERRDIKEKIMAMEADLEKKLAKIIDDDTNEDVDLIQVHRAKYAYFKFKP